jgi:hypothetical protein
MLYSQSRFADNGINKSPLEAREDIIPLLLPPPSRGYRPKCIVGKYVVTLRIGSLQKV